MLLSAWIGCASPDPNSDPNVIALKGGAAGTGGASGQGAGATGAAGDDGGAVPFPDGGSTGGASAGGPPSAGGQSAGGPMGTGGAGGASAGASAGGASTGGAGGLSSGGTGAAGAATECTPGATEDTGACGNCGTLHRVCSAAGSWGAPACQMEGACKVGATETQKCGNCGTQTRTCTATCAWSAWGNCGGTGPCAPGQTEGTGCEACDEKVCDASCQWTGCQLKPTSQCDWKNGTHFKCCGGGNWAFCAQSCTWNPCAPSGGSCP